MATETEFFDYLFHKQQDMNGFRQAVSCFSNLGVFTERNVFQKKIMTLSVLSREIHKVVADNKNFENIPKWIQGKKQLIEAIDFLSLKKVDHVFLAVCDMPILWAIEIMTIQDNNIVEQPGTALFQVSISDSKCHSFSKKYTFETANSQAIAEKTLKHFQELDENDAQFQHQLQSHRDAFYSAF